MGNVFHSRRGLFGKGIFEYISPVWNGVRIQCENSLLVWGASMDSLPVVFLGFALVSIATLKIPSQKLPIAALPAELQKVIHMLSLSF